MSATASATAENETNGKRVSLRLPGLPASPGSLSMPLQTVPADKINAQIAATIKRSYPSSHFSKGLYLKKHGQKDEALLEFIKAVQENPREVRAFFEQAKLFEELGKPKLARSALEQALSINPSYADARSKLMTLYFSQGDFLAAAGQLGKMVEGPKVQVKTKSKPTLKQTPPPPSTSLPGLMQMTHGFLPEPPVPPPTLEPPQTVQADSSPSPSPVQEPAMIPGLPAALSAINVPPAETAAVTPAPSTAAVSNPQKGSFWDRLPALPMPSLTNSVAKALGSIHFSMPAIGFKREEKTQGGDPEVLKLLRERNKGETLQTETKIKTGEDKDKPVAIEPDVVKVALADKTNDGTTNPAPAQDLNKLLASMGVKNEIKMPVAPTARTKDMSGQLQKIADYNKNTLFEKKSLWESFCEQAGAVIPQWSKISIPFLSSSAKNEKDGESEPKTPEEIDKIAVRHDKPAVMEVSPGIIAPPEPEKMAEAQPLPLPVEINNILANFGTPEAIEKAAARRAFEEPLKASDKAPPDAPSPQDLNDVLAKFDSSTSNSATLPAPSDASSLTVQNAVLPTPTNHLATAMNLTEPKTPTKLPETSPKDVPQAKPVALLPNLNALPALPKVQQKEQHRGFGFSLPNPFRVFSQRDHLVPEPQLAIKTFAQTNPTPAPIPSKIDESLSLPQPVNSLATNINPDAPVPKDVRDVLNKMNRRNPLPALDSGIDDGRGDLPEPQKLMALNVSGKLPELPQQNSETERIQTIPQPSQLASPDQGQIPKLVSPKPVNTDRGGFSLPALFRGIFPSQASDQTSPQPLNHTADFRTRVEGPGPIPVNIAEAGKNLPQPVSLGNDAAGIGPVVDAPGPIPAAVQFIMESIDSLVKPTNPPEQLTAHAQPISGPPNPASLDQTPAVLTAPRFDEMPKAELNPPQGNTYKYLKPSLDPRAQYFDTTQRRTIQPVEQSKLVEREKPKLPEDDYTKRMKYLLENGTVNLKPGEGFMFSEETGEGTLYMEGKDTIRRKIAEPKNHDAVVRARRPDIIKPRDLQYELALLGKILGPAKQTGPKVGDQKAVQSGPTIDSLLNQSQGFWSWLQDSFKK